MLDPEIIIFPAVIIGFMVFAGLMIMVTTRLQFPGQLASIERLRLDMQKVGNKQSHEVIAQATQWNQTIASAKKYRTLWWAKIFLPPGWEQVKEIEIPNWENG